MQETATESDPVALANDYLTAVRREEPARHVARALRDLSPRTLRDALDGDDARLAFWVNVYNAATQAVLAAAPEQYEDRRRFFSAPIVTVAGTRCSLDDIEHGILRRSQLPWGLGYLRRPDALVGAFERTHRLEARDPRVHFALNCGAASCPPVLAYTAADIDAELDQAARSYLEGTVEHDPEQDIVRVPRVMLWFVGDFGGREGVRSTLRAYDCIPEDAAPRLRFLDWDWSVDPGGVASQPDDTPRD